MKKKGTWCPYCRYYVTTRARQSRIWQLKHLFWRLVRKPMKEEIAIEIPEDKNYAVRPGFVKSLVDGQVRYIHFTELVTLYNVPMDQCVIWDGDWPETFRNKQWDDFVHLFPMSNHLYASPCGEELEKAPRS